MSVPSPLRSQVTLGADDPHVDWLTDRSRIRRMTVVRNLGPDAVNVGQYGHVATPQMLRSATASPLLLDVGDCAYVAMPECADELWAAVGDGATAMIAVLEMYKPPTEDELAAAGRLSRFERNEASPRQGHSQKHNDRVARNLKINELHDAGVKTADIVKQIGVSTQTVNAALGPTSGRTRRVAA
jgi:hypothetical protein